ncbi:hypothetical protein DIJ61_00425 [Burkholderia pseudomallei]|nr:hypothetical protein DIJ61_00425 [Burkholderia pseudomallei]
MTGNGWFIAGRTNERSGKGAAAPRKRGGTGAGRRERTAGKPHCASNIDGRPRAMDGGRRFHDM